MADYTTTTWVDDDGSGTVGTALTATRLNKLEGGVKDAAQDSKQRGLIASRPAAVAGNKNWIWIDDVTGQMSYSTGSAWIDIGQPNDESVLTMDNDGGTGLSNAGTGFPTEAWGTTALQKIATKFTTGATGFKATAVEVTLALAAVLETAGANNITAEIWSTTGSGSSEHPNVAISGGWTATRLRRLDTTSITVAFTGGTSSNGPTLAGSTTYWLVLSVATPLATAQILSQLGTAATANSLSRYNGSTWTTVTGTLSFSLKAGYPMAGLRVRNRYPDTVPNTIAGTEGFYGAGVISSSLGPAVIAVGSPAVRAFASRMGPAVSATAPTDAAVLARRASSGASADMFRAEDENSVSMWRVNERGNVAQGVLTTLPSSPDDGERIVYKATNTGSTDVMWQLVWDATTSRWYYIGGPPLLHVVNTQEAYGGPAPNFVDLATVGPTIAAPRPGVYRVFAEAVPLGGASNPALMQIQHTNNGTGEATSLSDMLASKWEQLNFSAETTIAAAGHVQKLMYRNILHTSGDFTGRRLSLLPVYIT